MLYFCGRGGSKTHYNNLARIKGFQQLGFSVLAIDYRGYGLSEGQLPNETRLYEDSQAAWDYLTGERQSSPEDIVIYGESLGGAVAIDLAIRQPDALPINRPEFFYLNGYPNQTALSCIKYFSPQLNSA